VQIVAKNSVYGSLALLPLFMFWLYITWCVALLGLKLSYVLQYWPLLKKRFFFTRGGYSNGMSDLRWVLSLGVVLHNRFKTGKSTHIDEAAELLMLPNDITGELMLSLEKAKLVHATSRGAYSLARPAETITAYDLLTAARLMCQVPPDLANESSHVKTYPNSPALGELERIEAEWAKRHTLVDLAKGPG
jgi:membrane protein